MAPIIKKTHNAKKCDMQNFRKIYVVHTELWPFKVSLKSLTNTKMTKK